MSYFNPKIYNKQNLKEDDLSELEYWNKVFTTLIDNQKEGFFHSGSPTFDKMRQEFLNEFCEQMKTALGYEMQNNVVAIIDEYEETVPEREEYETFLYYSDVEDDEE